MSNFANRAPLQWSDLHIFTDTDGGGEEAVRLQMAQGDMGPQYSISLGRYYNDKFTGFFRPHAPDMNFGTLERLYADAKAYANEHKAQNGGGQQRNDRGTGGAKDRDWSGGDDRGRGKRGRA